VVLAIVAHEVLTRPARPSAPFFLRPARLPSAFRTRGDFFLRVDALADVTLVAVVGAQVSGKRGINFFRQLAPHARRLPALGAHHPPSLRPVAAVHGAPGICALVCAPKIQTQNLKHLNSLTIWSGRTTEPQNHDLASACILLIGYESSISYYYRFWVFRGSVVLWFCDVINIKLLSTLFEKQKRGVSTSQTEA